jgi:predicted nucleic acid-binding protein
MRIFLDANILFSAAKSDGAIRKLLSLLQGARHELVADTYVLAEARRNLELKHPHALATLDALAKTLEVTVVPPTAPSLATKLPLPDKDKPVLLAAVAAQCDALVTGDQTHFGPLFGQRIGGVTIHSPRSLAEEVL